MKFLGFGLVASGILLMVAAFRNESPLAIVQNRAKGGNTVSASQTPSRATEFQEQVPQGH